VGQKELFSPAKISHQKALKVHNLEINSTHVRQKRLKNITKQIDFK